MRLFIWFSECRKYIEFDGRIWWHQNVTHNYYIVSDKRCQLKILKHKFLIGFTFIYMLCGEGSVKHTWTWKCLIFSKMIQKKMSNLSFRFFCFLLHQPIHWLWMVKSRSSLIFLAITKRYHKRKIFRSSLTIYLYDPICQGQWGTNYIWRMINKILRNSYISIS